ncbi:MAG: transcription termination/antitermination factor NusG [Bdellovibrionales bacterium]|nr:transcription termination/antitermination factor NusG [Bdellovibrionales bacterium]
MEEQSLKWYILKTKTRCEARAKHMIEEMVKNEKLEGAIQEILIPEKNVIQVLKGKKVKRSKKIYPGYIFLKMKFTNELSYKIKNLTNVVHFVGKRLKPLEVPPEQLKVIDQQIEKSSENPESEISFSEGEAVLVIDGPFKGFNGTVEEVNQEKARVKVSVSIFGRPTPVDFDFSQVHREV